MQQAKHIATALGQSLKELTTMAENGCGSGDAPTTTTVSRCTTVEATRSKPRKQDPAVMLRIWRRMSEIYGHKWVSQHGTQPSDTWTVALADVTVEQIAHAFRALLRELPEWPPSLPDFVRLCRPSPESLGLPSAREAFQEAAKNMHPACAASASWSHPAVYHAAREVGSSRFRTASAESVWKEFEHAYAVTVRAVIEGQELPEIPKALPAQVSRPTDQAEALKRIAAMKAAIGASRAQMLAEDACDRLNALRDDFEAKRDAYSGGGKCES